MNEDDLRQSVEQIASVLSSSGLRFHLTGGLASSYYGEPRVTRDADFVIRLNRVEVAPLLEALGDRFLVQKEAVLEAVRDGGMFQALDQETLIKADFHVGELIEGELGRSTTREVFEGLEIPLVSKEDAILSKLVWIREGSDRSRMDVIGMLLDPTPWDRAFVRDRAQGLGCGAILEKLERKAESFRGPGETVR